MKTHKVLKIQYKKSEEITERSIIATSLPSTNIQAIDVSNLDANSQVEIAEAYDKYAEYIKAHMRIAYSFEDWYSHSKGVDFTPNWRTFKAEKTTFLLS